MYRLQDLGTFRPAAMNAQGHVAGWQNRPVIIRDALGGPYYNEEAVLWDGKQIILIGHLPPSPVEDISHCYANAINNAGVVVGSSGSFGPASMSGMSFSGLFIWRGKKIIGSGGSVGEEGLGISDSGIIVGISGFRGFLLRPGAKNPDLVSPLSRRSRGNGSRLTAISPNGRFVAGASTVEDRRTAAQEDLPIHAVRGTLRGHTVSLYDLGTPSRIRHSFATSINNQGDTGGYATGEKFNVRQANPEGDHLNTRCPAVWRSGSHRPILLPLLPGDNAGWVQSINSQGALVGVSLGRDEKTRHAVLWDTGHGPVDLNTQISANAFPGILTEAVAINDRGQIAVVGLHKNGSTHALVLSR